jgi:hypothetical protein
MEGNKQHTYIERFFVDFIPAVIPALGGIQN